MTTAKPIYQAISLWDIISSFFLRVACLACMTYLAFQYTENPVLIFLLLAFCFFIFLSAGEDQLRLYDDRLTIQCNSILSWIRPGKAQTFLLEDIAAASLPQPDTRLPNGFEIGVLLVLSTIFPRKRPRRGETTVFFLHLKSGEHARIESGITNAQAKRLVHEITVLTNRTGC